MNSSVIRQALVASLLITIMCIALLVGALMIPSSIAGGHSSRTGTMLIAPPFQHQYKTEHEV
jgi:hypothetical protein